jgi:DNA-binding NarL/FixJ family response regulator
MKMSRILLGIYDDHLIAQEGICILLKDAPDFNIALKVHQGNLLVDGLKSTSVHILIINLHDLSGSTLELIARVSRDFPGIKVLILSALSGEEVILKSIKAGAKGFLAKDTDKNELMEAIYSLRNGYDYFSKSITHLLLNQYIRKLKFDAEKPEVQGLSSRETEILKLWGNSYTNKEIANTLFLSVRTVETHKNNIMQKLNLKTSVDMVKYAIRNNIIEI